MFGKAILPLGEKTRLISRGQLGATGLGELFELPPSLRFFTGGDNSVRGYEYNSIGEEDENGVVQGGINLLVGSLEIDHPVKGNWFTAVFIDTGTAFDNDPDFKQGAGVGIRWRSPIGPIRLDAAKPLNQSEDKYTLHFSVGVDL